MRVIGYVLAILGLAMGLYGFVRPGTNLCFIAFIPIIIGAILFAVAQREDKEAKEAERHAEMLEAIKRNKQS